MSDKIMCQADTSVKGDSVSPSALQSKDGAEAYPRDVENRFELRHGKYGPYFHDLRSNFDMPLDRVLNTLNRYALRKAQLTWYVATYGEPKATPTQSQIEERSDEVEPETKSAGLTHHQTKAQEIINWTISEGTKDFTDLHSAIVSALSEAYQSGRQESSPQLQKLREALEPFVIDWIKAGEHKPWIFDWPSAEKLSVNVTVEHLNHAHTVLQQTSPEATGGDNG